MEKSTSDDKGVNLLSMRNVCKRVGMQSSTVRLYIKQGKFPPGFSPSERVTLFKEEDIQKWIDDLVSA